MNYEKIVLRETQFYRGGWVGGVEKLQLLQGGHTARIMSSCPEMRLKKQNKKLHSMNSFFFPPQFLCLWVLECIRRKTSLCSVLGENRAPETLLEISCACHLPWDCTVQSGCQCLAWHVSGRKWWAANVGASEPRKQRWKEKWCWVNKIA